MSVEFASKLQSPLTVFYYFGTDNNPFIPSAWVSKSHLRSEKVLGRKTTQLPACADNTCSLAWYIVIDASTIKTPTAQIIRSVTERAVGYTTATAYLSDDDNLAYVSRCAGIVMRGIKKRLTIIHPSSNTRWATTHFPWRCGSEAELA